MRAREEARVLAFWALERQPRGSAHGRQERSDFLLISCLIRLIHLSLYREVYLSYKQDLLDPLSKRLINPNGLRPNRSLTLLTRGYVLLVLGHFELKNHILSDAARPADPAWSRMDCVVVSWLFNTISADLLSPGTVTKLSEPCY